MFNNLELNYLGIINKKYFLYVYFNNEIKIILLIIYVFF